MDEFPKAVDMVKSFCMKIRSIQFGDTARLVLGTPSGDPGGLNSAIIDAYSETIEHI